jgi:hypothetical protein
MKESKAASERTILTSRRSGAARLSMTGDIGLLPQRAADVDDLFAYKCSLDRRRFRAFLYDTRGAGANAEGNEMTIAAIAW